MHLSPERVVAGALEHVTKYVERSRGTVCRAHFHQLEFTHVQSPVTDDLRRGGACGVGWGGEWDVRRGVAPLAHPGLRKRTAFISKKRFFLRKETPKSVTFIEGPTNINTLQFISWKTEIIFFLKMGS